jgi:hypothetical protein
MKFIFLPFFFVTTLCAGQAGLIVTPQQFGAKADGISDDAPAFRAAFAALAASGGGQLIINNTGRPYVMGSWDATPRDGLLFVALIPSNVTITGNGTIKIKDNIYPYPTDGTGGVYYGINLFGAFSKSNITISGLTFDMNGQNNLQPPGLPHIMNTIRFYSGANVVIASVTIKNSPGHNMIVLEDNAGDGAVIRDSVFSVGGHGVRGNTLNSDFSFLYSEWGHTQFVNNTIFQDPSNDHASGGIELHGSHGLAQGNRIENCNPAIWIASTPGAVDDVIVTHNTIVNANRGIAFWVGAGVLSNVIVSSNTISVHYNPVFTYLYGLGDDAAGIIVPWLGAWYSGQYASWTANGAPIRNLTIKGNTIYSSDGMLGLNTMPGISIHGVHDALIADNIIHDVGSNAIELRGSPWGNRNVIIARNDLRNFGLSPSVAGHEAIAITTTGASAVPAAAGFDSTNVVIFANNLVGAPNITSQSFYFGWTQGRMFNLTTGINTTSNILTPAGGAQTARDGIAMRVPVEFVGSQPLQSPCMTGDIIWRTAPDTLDGWICAGGAWEVIGH